jgi:co-chaperonin GroES (HSP10)
MREIEGLHPHIPRPAGPWILLEPLKPRERTSAGGIVIPDEAQKSRQFLNPVCKVVALGPDAYRDPKLFPNGPRCGVGDYVLTNPYDGHKVEVKLNPEDHEAIPYRLIFDDKVIATTSAPEAIKVYCD